MSNDMAPLPEDDTLIPIGVHAQAVFLALALATMRFADDGKPTEQVADESEQTRAGR